MELQSSTLVTVPISVVILLQKVRFLVLSMNYLQMQKYVLMHRHVIACEEVCHDSSAMPYCAKISEGGCPCPNNNEVKCGASQYSSGYCARACCDWTVEEACFDENNKLLSCARFDEGGCQNARQRSVARWPNTALEGDKEGKGAHPSPSLVVFDKGKTAILPGGTSESKLGRL